MSKMNFVKSSVFVLYLSCTVLSVMGLKNEEAVRAANNAVLIAFQDIQRSGGPQRVLQSYKGEVPAKVRKVLVGLEPIFEQNKNLVRPQGLQGRAVLETAAAVALIGIAVDAVHKAGGPQKILDDGGEFIKHNWQQVSDFTENTVQSIINLFS